jgi:hypothetical protein
LSYYIDAETVSQLGKAIEGVRVVYLFSLSTRVYASAMKSFSSWGRAVTKKKKLEGSEKQERRQSL